jgi:hypothetical protein
VRPADGSGVFAETVPRSGTKITKITKTTNHFVFFVSFVAFVPERNLASVARYVSLKPGRYSRLSSELADARFVMRMFSAS